MRDDLEPTLAQSLLVLGALILALVGVTAAVLAGAILSGAV